MLNKTDINKIKSDYTLKSVFTYIDYISILKIIKNNKKLQNRLRINVENYKEKSDFPKYEYYTSEKIIKKRVGIGGQDLAEAFQVIISSCCTCILFIYSIIYSILLVTLDSFDDSNTKENYDKSSANIIKIINALTFIFDGVTISTPFIFNFYLFKNIEMDYGIKRFIKSSIFIIINLTHFSFEGLIIWKLVLSYEIKKGDATWFMIMDYIFLTFNFIYIIYILIFTFFYFADSGRAILKIKKCYLKSFNGISIYKYALPENFDKWKKKDRKKYILNNYHYFEYVIPNNQETVLNSINILRDIKNIKRLEIDKNKCIPEFIVNKPIELLLNPDKNIFKLSNNKFLFKYPEGIFEKELKKRNENILNILLNNNLSHIQIIDEGDYQYIMISSKPFSMHYGDAIYSSFEEDLYSYKKIKDSDEYDSDYNSIINIKNIDYLE